jgi:hypothetical protein
MAGMNGRIQGGFCVFGPGSRVSAASPFDPAGILEISAVGRA